MQEEGPAGGAVPADLEMHAKKTNSCKTTHHHQPPVAFTCDYSRSVTGALDQQMISVLTRLTNSRQLVRKSEAKNLNGQELV